MLSLTCPTAKATTLVINGSHSISSARPKIVSIGSMNCSGFGLPLHRSIVISNAHQKRFNSGRTQATADDLAKSTKDTFDAAVDKTAEAAQSAKDAIEQKQKEGKASTDDLTQSVKDTANAAKEKTLEAVESTKQTAQQQQDQGKAKTDELVESAKNTADSVKDKTLDASQSIKENAQENQEKTTDFLKQAGEQASDATQNALDSVKKALS